MYPRVIGLGAGGHAKVVIEILQLAGNCELAGLVDADPKMANCEILGVPIVGDDSVLPKLVSGGVTHFFIGVGMVGSAVPRRRLYELALKLGLQPVNAIHPRAILAQSVKFMAGLTIMAGGIVNPCATLGTNVIINTGAIVEHDCVIEDHVHVATGARLAGQVTVGEGSHVGIGASIRQGIHIGKNAIVGAGAVVVKDVSDNAVVAGVPARIIRMNG